MRIFWMLVLTIGFFCNLSAQDDFGGMASFYADKFVGKPTASGEAYRHQLYTCAHKTLPFGTKLKVTNPKNNESVIVVVNDRGPFIKSRVIDLSKAAAKDLGIIQQGIAYVEIEILSDEDDIAAGASLETSEVLDTEVPSVF